MHNHSTTVKLTVHETQRNKAISKIRYIVEQQFDISHLHVQAKRAKFTTIIKNKFDDWFRQAFVTTKRFLPNLKIESKVSFSNLSDFPKFLFMDGKATVTGTVKVICARQTD